MPNHNTHSGLAGRRVLVTRPAEQAEEFIISLTNSGAEAVLFPTIRVVPADNRSDCNKALENFENWNALVFTSANGIRFFVEHMQTEFPHLMAPLQRRTVYAVGEKTAAKAATFGLSAIHFEETRNAEQLADVIAQRVKGSVLFPCGNRTGDAMIKKLERAGIAVKPVIVYQTLAFRPNNTESVVSELKNERIDAVTFFSPSSIKHFLDLVPQPLLERCAVAVIGSTTADAARTFGLHPDIIAQKSDSRELIKTLENYYLG